MTPPVLRSLGFVFRSSGDWFLADRNLVLVQIGSAWKLTRDDRPGCKILSSRTRNLDRANEDILEQLSRELEAAPVLLKRFAVSAAALTIVGGVMDLDISVFMVDAIDEQHAEGIGLAIARKVWPDAKKHIVYVTPDTHVLTVETAGVAHVKQHTPIRELVSL